MKSLRRQLTLRLLAGGTLLLILAGLLFRWQIRRALVAELNRSVMATFQTMVMTVEQKNGHLQIDLADTDVSQLEDPHGNAAFLVRTTSGEEIMRSVSLGTAQLPTRYGSLGAPTFFDSRLPDGRLMRWTAIRITPPYEDEIERPPKVDAILTVGIDRSPVDRQLRTIEDSLLLAGGIALAMLGAFVYLGVRAGLTPLDRLSASVATVDAASLATRFPKEALPAELQPIAVRLNELLARLQSAFARERRFTSAAAHELRTPLAELRALAEVNLTTPSSAAEAEQSWRDVLATVLSMESLASRLLDLSRTEDATRVLHVTNVPLAQAIAAAWEPWRARAVERQIKSEIALAPNLEAEVDPTVLSLVLGNLCSNAIEHSRKCSTVKISGSQIDDGVRLHFQNETNSITASDLPHMFERAWQKEGAHHDGQHHGLGLTLAAEFADLLGGRLRAELIREGTVAFTLWLPSRTTSNNDSR
jgi:two-component system sensor histidine kinase QseC